jgi:hypothetical protein
LFAFRWWWFGWRVDGGWRVTDDRLVGDVVVRVEG